MYEKILVPLDGSPVDRAIIDHVTKLAAIHKSTVILIRVAHYHTRDAQAHELQTAQAYLDTVQAELNRQGIATETILDHGEPAETILAHAEFMGCDLIAMATHGHRLLGDLLFGSVASELRHRTSIPILLIRASEA